MLRCWEDCMACNINVLKFQKVNLFKNHSTKKYFLCFAVVVLYPFTLHLKLNNHCEVLNLHIHIR